MSPFSALLSRLIVSQCKSFLLTCTNIRRLVPSSAFWRVHCSCIDCSRYLFLIRIIIDDSQLFVDRLQDLKALSGVSGAQLTASTVSVRLTNKVESMVSKLEAKLAALEAKEQKTRAAVEEADLKVTTAQLINAMKVRNMFSGLFFSVVCLLLGFYRYDYQRDLEMLTCCVSSVCSE